MAGLNVREERNAPNFIDDCHLNSRPYARHPASQHQCCLCIGSTTRCANEGDAEYDICNLPDSVRRLFNYDDCCTAQSQAELTEDTNDDALSDNEQPSPSSSLSGIYLFRVRCHAQ